MALTQAQIEALYSSILQIDSSELSASDQSDIQGLVAASTAGSTDAQIQDSIVNSTLAANTVEPLLRIYQSAFGRKADVGGLNFYADQLRNGQTTIDTIAKEFAASPEFTSRFPNAETDTSNFVSSLYTNVLGREADAAGQAFWANSGLSAAQLLTAFSQSGEFMSRTNGAIDSYLNARAAGEDVNTDEDIFDGAAGVPQIAGVVDIDGVTGEANTIAGITVSDSDSNNSTVTLKSGNGGLINVKETGITTATIEGNGTSTVVLKGTIGTETGTGINAALVDLTFISNSTSGGTDSFTITAMDATNNSSVKTVNVTLAGLQELTAAADSLVGTANADFFRADAVGVLAAGDTITDTTAGDKDVLSVSSINDATGAFTASGIETIRGTGADANTITLSNVTGITTLENSSKNALTFASPKSIDGVMVKINDGATSTIVTDIDLSGASDNMMVNLNKVMNTTTVSATAAAAGTLETLTLMGSGNNNGATPAVMSVVTLADEAATAATINASAIADGVSLAGFGTADQTITLGAGNDMLDFTANDSLTTADTIDGGAGTDRVMIDVANLTGVLTNLSNIEELEIADSAVNETVELTGFATAPKLIFSASLGNGTTTVNYAKDVVVDVAAPSASANLVLAATGGAGVTNDTATVNLSANISSLNASSTENLTLNNVEGNSIIASNVVLGTQGTNTLTITGSNNLDIQGTTSADVVDASAATGNVTTGLAIASTYRGGEGVDTVTGSTGIDVLVGGAGNDSLTGGDGADVFGGGAGADAIDLTDTDSAIDEVHFSVGSGTAVTAGNDAADTVAAFEVGEDKIFFLDNGATDGGSVNFAATDGTAGAQGTAFTAGAVATANFASDTQAAINTAGAANSNKVIVLDDAFADEATFEAYTATGLTNAYVVANATNDATSQAASIYFDADWSDVAGRELIADITLTGASDVEDLTAIDFGIYA